MKSLLTSELLKLRTVRAPRVTLLGLLALTLLVAGVAAASIPSDAAPDEGLRTVLGVAGGFFPALVMLVLGVLSVAGEFHHGTIVGSYLVTPDRRRVLAAKVLVLGGVGAVVGLACVVVTVALAVPIADGRGVDTGVGDAGAAAGLVAACVAVAGLAAALGVGLGACFRAPVVAVIAVVAWSSFGESVVGVLVPEPLLPFGAIRGAVSPTGDLPGWLGAALLAAYASAAIALAARSYTRKDVAA
jgi:ABC-2 type transport system permease protein